MSRQADGAHAAARTPTVITHEGGLKFAAQVRSHRIAVDQPHRGGGDDTAPSPIELLGAALGTCVALYVHQFCETRGLAHDELRVEVESASATNPSRIARFHVRLALPASLPPEYASMLERVARSCPVHNTLAHGADVTVQIETVVPAMT